MPSDRFNEFLRNASPEVKAQIAATGEKVTRTTPDTLQQPEGVTTPGPMNEKVNANEGKLSEPVRGHLQSLDNQQSQQPERRIDQAMNQKAQMQAVEQGKEATQSGVSIEESKAPIPPAKEPER